MIPILGVSQNKIQGEVVDALSGDRLVGVSIQELGTSNGVITDLTGAYSLSLSKIPAKVIVQFFGYVTDTLEVTKPGLIEITMRSNSLDVVEVVSDISIDQKTPVAISKISTRQIAEELASQDLPMVLNSTPGVTATQQGGGDGDARITIRGFSQRNIAVMIDGVPVNDMENGWVYWSNWFGLDMATQAIQVQRGLGASKIAVPSVGGTMNIISTGMQQNFSLKFKQEVANNRFFRTSLSYNSGRLKGDWGLTIAASYKNGQGWVDANYTEGLFYFVKAEKKIKNHLLSFSTYGAPQRHGQRSYTRPISDWDRAYAASLGIDTSEMTSKEYGMKYNEFWGYQTQSDGSQEIRNSKENYYIKPQFILRDFWNVNSKMSVVNTVYSSIGFGGGTSFYNYSGVPRDSNDQVNWDQIYTNNRETNLFGSVYPNIDTYYDSVALKSNNILTAAVNNHYWLGYIGQINYKLNENWNFAGGLDYRFYAGRHYREVKDLLGGDYFVNDANENSPSDMKRVGDRIGWKPFHNDRTGYVQWVAGFFQAEYSSDKWSWYGNVSAVGQGYKGVDYFVAKELTLGDSTYSIPYGDTLIIDGIMYTNDSEELEYSQTNWKWVPGYTIKSGASYTFNKKHSVFLNLGWMSKPPLYSNVIDNVTNDFFVEIKNEEIRAAEFGYKFGSRKFSINFNSYVTYWINKPFPYGVQVPDPNDPLEFITANINGMNALHMGAEVDFAYKIAKWVTLEGMVSLGDWTWQSADTVFVEGTPFSFDAKGVHVGDAAQFNAGGAVRFQPFKGAYIKLRYTYFDKYYSDFDPFTLNEGNEGRESWRIPAYGIMDIHLGYTYKMRRIDLGIRGSILNALNTTYISDADNNGYSSDYDDFDAKSATVFFGQGIRWNVSLQITLKK